MINLNENIFRLKNLMGILNEESSWSESNNKLNKTYQFNSFKDAIEFVNKVANIAEEQNHHPDITILYDKVKLSITDHDKGKVSEKCHKFVDAVSKMVDNKKDVQEDKDESAKWIKCRNCKKKYTQTIHKGKKSKAICPHCGTHEDLM